ncbi:hypothetical protein GGH19_000542 [Coemansia sp. RSA 1807]|nr:hypothetical protein GGH19_000542 [Coemansia sp. RSA 1807]
MSVSDKMYFSDVLYIAISEIAYYRYLLPESFFDDALFEDVEVHRIMKGKSVESDTLLEVLSGACDALAKGVLKTLTFGLSVHPDDVCFIREIYAFQFEPSGGDRGGQDKGGRDTGRALLFRLSVLLQEMEPLSVPVFLSARLTLAQNAHKDYVPPSFVLNPLGKTSGFSILPQFGSAQVGTIRRMGLEGSLCVVSVEGVVQQPPLGSTKCQTPVQVDLDDNPNERVFVAVSSAIIPHASAIVTRQQQKKCILNRIRSRADSETSSAVSQAPTPVLEDDKRLVKRQICECQIFHDEEMRTCYRCKRQFHVQCYEMEGDLVPLLAICLTCQAHDASGTVATFSLCRLALARRAAGLAYKQKTERVTWLMKHMGCKIDKGRSIIEAIRAFGLLQIDKNARPKMFTVAYSSWPSAQAVLFGTDIEAAIAATAIQKGKR